MDLETYGSSACPRGRSERNSCLCRNGHRQRYPPCLPPQFLKILARQTPAYNGTQVLPQKCHIMLRLRRACTTPDRRFRGPYSAGRLKKHAVKCLRLKSYLRSPSDGRKQGRIPATALLWALLMGVLLRRYPPTIPLLLECRREA
jgi:hypothetical protein